MARGHRLFAMYKIKMFYNENSCQRRLIVSFVFDFLCKWLFICAVGTVEFIKFGWCGKDPTFLFFVFSWSDFPEMFLYMFVIFWLYGQIFRVPYGCILNFLLIYVLRLCPLFILNIQIGAHGAPRAPIS